jgi:hypothetical protein
MDGVAPVRVAVRRGRDVVGHMRVDVDWHDLASSAGDRSAQGFGLRAADKEAARVARRDAEALEELKRSDGCWRKASRSRRATQLSGATEAW